MIRYQKDNLPPVGALTHIAQLKPGEPLTIVSPAILDRTIMDARISPNGVTVEREPREVIRGLMVWNRNQWDDLPISVASLNLVVDDESSKNDFSDAFVFRNHDLALKFAEWCRDHPDDRKWHNYPDGLQRNKAVRPYWPTRDGTAKRPSYD